MFGAIVVGLLVSGLAAGGIVVRRAWSRRLPVRHVPPLIVMPRPVTRTELTPSAGVRPSPPAVPLSGDNGGTVVKPPPQSRPTIGERVLFDDSRLADVGDVPARGANSQTVRFLRPGEEPVQILPGRLEVLSGETRHREIMFVRAPGEPAELILGREPGHSPQAVALQSDTVSRQHARFTYSDGHWVVTNLSRTNPVVVNDERIVDSSTERPLADGDRVELGEVVLRFRSR